MRPLLRAAAVLGLLSLSACNLSTVRQLPARPEGDLRVGIAPGNLAQDIFGEDADGKPFKLSDYKGKVVLLDFWALR